MSIKNPWKIVFNFSSGKLFATNNNKKNDKILNQLRNKNNKK